MENNKEKVIINGKEQEVWKGIVVEDGLIYTNPRKYIDCDGRELDAFQYTLKDNTDIIDAIYEYGNMNWGSFLLYEECRTVPYGEDGVAIAKDDKFILCGFNDYIVRYRDFNNFKDDIHVIDKQYFENNYKLIDIWGQ